MAAAMDELLAYSERVVRDAIRELPDGRYQGAGVLETHDGDLELRAAVTVAGSELEIDFAGTSSQHAGSLNCPLAVTRSACFYVVRCLTAPDLPASGGAFAPVTVRAPDGSLVNARPPAAVAAGNTEASSRIVDVVFAALAGWCRCRHRAGDDEQRRRSGTSEGFAYYETIAGGQGACPDADGPSAVHVAMSNTLSTPVEALELAYPLGVERYSLRQEGSGGAGASVAGTAWSRLRALDRAACRSLAAAPAPPRGADSGEDGLPGRTSERDRAPRVRDGSPRGRRPAAGGDAGGGGCGCGWSR